MSLRWRIAIGFALVALATAAVIGLATPPIVTQGFSDIDVDQDSIIVPGGSTTPTAQPGNEEDGAAVTAAATTVAGAPATTGIPTGQAQQITILRLLLISALAASVASLLGLFAAGRLVRPLKQLEDAAVGLARGDLARRSGLAGRSDEFGRLGRTFDSMAIELQAADETRRHFLQDAAHELKTPLAVIDATSSAILDGIYQPERRHVETIREQSRVLARIVDDLRTISLAEGGNLPLDRRPLDARRVLELVGAAFEARAAAASVNLAVVAPAGLAVEADPDRLRQMLGALVDNAIRHTPAGGAVRISAMLPNGHGRQAAARAQVRLVVEDSGQGIPPEALPRIFERFYQADPSHGRGTGTSGLGLSIVKALAQAQGGTVGAENRAEGGARLWVELPAIRPA